MGSGHCLHWPCRVTAIAFLDLLERHIFSVGGELRLASFEGSDELVVHVINVAKPYGFIPEALLELLGLFVDLFPRVAFVCRRSASSSVFLSCYTSFELGAFPLVGMRFFRRGIMCDAVSVFNRFLRVVFFGPELSAFSVADRLKKPTEKGMAGGCLPL